MIQLLFNFNFIKKKKSKKTEFVYLSEEDESADVSYIAEIKKLKTLKEPPETVLEVIDALARDFLRKKFHIRRNAEYSEITEIFIEKNKPLIVEFCRRMTEALYSGEEITHGLVEDLTADFESIINREGLGEELGAKEDIFTSMINKIKILDYGEKKEGKKGKENYVGKNTRKVIKSRILGKKQAIPEKLDFSMDVEKSAPKENSNSTALSFLQDQTPEISEEEERHIASIDDLDRIRSRIQQRKRAVETPSSG